MTPSWWADHAPELADLLDPTITEEQAAMLCAVVRRERPWQLAVECLRRGMTWADFYGHRLQQAAAAVQLARTLQYDYSLRDLWWHAELPEVEDSNTPPELDDDGLDDEDKAFIASRTIHFSFLRRVRAHAGDRREPAKATICPTCGQSEKLRRRLVKVLSAGSGAVEWRGWLVCSQQCKRIVQGVPGYDESLLQSAAWQFDVNVEDLKTALDRPSAP